MMDFAPAVLTKGYLRLGLSAVSGGGKTYTALRLATEIARSEGGDVALIDSERGSAAKYSRIFPFQHVVLNSFSPQAYIEWIMKARGRFPVLIIDGISQAWAGSGGELEMVDNAKARAGGNSWAAWRDVTPLHNKFIDTMLDFNGHLIATMRSKTEWVQEKGPDNKTVIRKVGMAPVQRDGMEYEMDVMGDLTQENVLIITKTRCPDIQGAVIRQPGEDFAKTLLAWVGQGEAPMAAAPAPPVEAPPPPTTPGPAPTPPKHTDPPCDAALFNRTWHATVANTPLVTDEKRHEYVLAFTKKQWPNDPNRHVASLTTFLKGDAEHGTPPASESEANTLIAAVEKSIQQRRTAEQAQRIDEKTTQAKDGAKSKARQTAEEKYATLLTAAGALEIDLAPFELDASVGDDELNIQLAKLAAAVRIANEQPREAVAP